MKKIIFTLTALLFITACTTNSNSETPLTQHHKRAQVTLTYDDALNIHLDKVAPALEARNFRGTFYITASSDPFHKRINDWRELATKGHELGNHTLYHPCEGNRPGREWVSTERDLGTWSVERFISNVKMTNTVLEAVDSKSARTFAYTCGDTKASNQSFIQQLKPNVIAARAVGGESQPLGEVDLMNIHSHMVYNDSAEKMIALVDDAIERGTWLVFLFHGVGGEHDLNVSEDAHTALLDHLQKHRDKVWVAPTIEIVKTISAKE
ncbi:polysaccharide deacetylase family protein [Teredinibacter haidensis]|uniref:polysaccharide deacetylase family protein n=1 Tax=Teredinibacter haidensis TaxID=2731755 RepID=UPI000948D052|nr:polysaccharide deacetylase family protein [Teredinibacter haidensis]